MALPITFVDPVVTHQTRFIVIEGGPGVGKTTFTALLKEAIESIAGFGVVLGKDPWPQHGYYDLIVERLKSGAGADVMAMLYMAARLDHWREVIYPALDRGAVVLQDRFQASTDVYQGILGAQQSLINPILNSATNIRLPLTSGDLIIHLRATPEKMLERINQRGGAHGHETADDQRVYQIARGYQTVMNRRKNVWTIDTTDMTPEDLKTAAERLARLLRNAQLER